MSFVWIGFTSRFKFHSTSNLTATNNSNSMFVYSRPLLSDPITHIIHVYALYFDTFFKWRTAPLSPPRKENNWGRGGGGKGLYLSNSLCSRNISSEEFKACWIKPDILPACLEYFVGRSKPDILPACLEYFVGRSKPENCKNLESP